MISRRSSTLTDEEEESGGGGGEGLLLEDDHDEGGGGEGELPQYTVGDWFPADRRRQSHVLPTSIERSRNCCCKSRAACSGELHLGTPALIMNALLLASLLFQAVHMLLYLQGGATSILILLYAL